MPKPRRKVVVRELPHLLTREAFVASIAKWYSPPAADASSATNAACPTGDIEYLAYYPGRVASGSKSAVASRAYLAFRDVRALGRFYTDFSQQLFVDEKGREYRPLIEYAPYQRLPAALSGAGAGAKKKPAKPAAKGRPDSAPSLSAPALPLLDDAHYLKFLEQLNAPKEPPSAAAASELQPELRQLSDLDPAAAANGTAPPVKLPPVLLDLLARHKTKTSKKQQQQQQQQQQRLKRANAQARKRQKEERGAAAAAAAATIQPTAFVDLADANASPSRSFTTAPSPASKSKAKKDAPAVVRIITRESAANAKSATSSPMALHQKAPSSAPNLSTSAKRDGKRKAPFDANKHAAPTAATVQPSTAAAAATSFAQSRTPSPHATPYTPSGAVPAVVPSAASAGTASSAAGPRARGGGNKRGGKRGGGARGRGGSDTKLS